MNGGDGKGIGNILKIFKSKTQGPPTVHLIDPNNVCFRCQYERHNDPTLQFWRAGCGHIVCPDCYRKFFSREMYKCNICQAQLVGSDFQLEPLRAGNPAVSNMYGPSGQNTAYFGQQSSSTTRQVQWQEPRSPPSPRRSAPDATLGYYGYPTPPQENLPHIYPNPASTPYPIRPGPYVHQQAGNSYDGWPNGPSPVTRTMTAPAGTNNLHHWHPDCRWYGEPGVPGVRNRGCPCKNSLG